MVNKQFEKEYDDALEKLKIVIEAYRPFINSKDKWLTDQEITASENLDIAEQEWFTVGKKYLNEK